MELVDKQILIDKAERNLMKFLVAKKTKHFSVSLRNEKGKLSTLKEIEKIAQRFIKNCNKNETNADWTYELVTIEKRKTTWRIYYEMPNHAIRFKTEKFILQHLDPGQWGTKRQREQYFKSKGTIEPNPVTRPIERIILRPSDK